MTTFPVGRPKPTVAMLRFVALLLGLWYLGIGIAGIVTNGLGDMGANSGRSMWVFGISALVNIGHLGVGILGVIAAHGEPTVRAFGWLSFFGFTGLTAYGILAVTVHPAGNLANMAPANVCLYGTSALLGLLLCLLPVQQPSR